MRLDAAAADRLVLWIKVAVRTTAYSLANRPVSLRMEECNYKVCMELLWWQLFKIANQHQTVNAVRVRVRYLVRHGRAHLGHCSDGTRDLGWP